MSNTIPESNKIGPNGEAVDRLYCDLYGHLNLILKNGKEYEGKIDKKSIKNADGTLNHVYHANTKWFNRMGQPIDKPDNLITREKE